MKAAPRQSAPLFHRHASDGRLAQSFLALRIFRDYHFYITIFSCYRRNGSASDLRNVFLQYGSSMTVDRTIRAFLSGLVFLIALHGASARAETVDLQTTFARYAVELDHGRHRLAAGAPDSFCGHGAWPDPLCGLETFYRCLMTPLDRDCSSVSFLFREQAAASGGKVAPEDFTWQVQAAEFELKAFEHPNIDLVLLEVRERLCWGDKSAWVWQPDWRSAHYILWWTKNQRWEVVASIPVLPLMHNRSEAQRGLTAIGDLSGASPCGAAP